MIKTIKISGKQFNMKSSAWTPFKYEMDYGVELLKDLNNINKIATQIGKLPKEEQETEWADHITGILKMALQIAYTMITEYEKEFDAYDEWLKGLDELFSDFGWVQEVIELAMSTFRGKLPSTNEQK